MIWIADIDGPNSSVEMCQEHHALVVDGREIFVCGVCAEAPSAAAKVAARFGDRPRGDSDRLRLLGNIENTQYLSGLKTFIGERLAGNKQEITSLAGFLLREFRKRDTKHRECRVCAELRRKIDPSDLRIAQVLVRGLLGTVAGASHGQRFGLRRSSRSVGKVDAVPFGPGRNWTVQVTLARVPSSQVAGRASQTSE